MVRFAAQGLPYGNLSVVGETLQGGSRSLGEILRGLGLYSPSNGLIELMFMFLTLVRRSDFDSRTIFSSPGV